MITDQQTIEIGGVKCSIDFENGFFQDEFNLILADYQRQGFYAEGESDINIVVKGSLLPPPSKVNKNIFYHSMEYGSVYATMLFDTEKFGGEIGLAIKKDDKYALVRMTEMIETFICNAYIFYLSMKDLGTFIHSCGVADKGNGYIFASTGEGGKSTIARLSDPRTVLSDELIILRKGDNGKRIVFGTPFRGELEGVNKGVNCKALFFIEKSNTNEIIPVGRMAGIVELMKESVIKGFMSIDEIQKIYPYPRYLSLLIDLLEGIPCYRLRFKKDASFWEVINGE